MGIHEVTENVDAVCMTCERRVHLLNLFSSRQIVVGAPGSGKTTYCEALRRLNAAELVAATSAGVDDDDDDDEVDHVELGLRARRRRGRRCVYVINLDPAAEEASSSGRAPPAVCITDLISLDNICREENLGPNGGIYALCTSLLHPTMRTQALD